MKKYMNEYPKFYIWLNTDIKVEIDRNFTEKETEIYFKQFLNDKEYALMTKFKFYIFLGDKSICIAIPSEKVQQQSVKDFESVEDLQKAFSDLINQIKTNYFSNLESLPNSISDVVVFDYIFDNFKEKVIKSIQENKPLEKSLIDHVVDHQLPLSGLLSCLGG